MSRTADGPVFGDLAGEFEAVRDDAPEDPPESGESQQSDGLACTQCGGHLRTTSIGEGRTGALHEHLSCESCKSTGCLSTNMTGTKSVTRRGRALVGGGRRA